MDFYHRRVITVASNLDPRSCCLLAYRSALILDALDAKKGSVKGLCMAEAKRGSYQKQGEASRFLKVIIETLKCKPAMGRLQTGLAPWLHTRSSFSFQRTQSSCKLISVDLPAYRSPAHSPFARTIQAAFSRAYFIRRASPSRSQIIHTGNSNKEINRPLRSRRLQRTQTASLARESRQTNETHSNPALPRDCHGT